MKGSTVREHITEEEVRACILLKSFAEVSAEDKESDYFKELREAADTVTKMVYAVKCKYPKGADND